MQYKWGNGICYLRRVETFTTLVTSGGWNKFWPLGGSKNCCGNTEYGTII